MKNRKTKLVVLFLGLGVAVLHAQNSTSAAGVNASGSGG